MTTDHSTIITGTLMTACLFRFLPSPGWDLDNGVLRAWWFDPLTATLGFAVSINVYSYYERQLGKNTCQTWKQWVSVDLSDQPVVLSLISYWAGLLIWKRFIPPPSPNGFIPDGLPHDVPSFLYLAAEVAIGILLYDAIFFAIHWALHECSVFKRFHRVHHSHRRRNGKCVHVEARDVLRHSLVDGSLQVLVNIAVQRHAPWGAVKSRLARALHNIFVTWMLTESHAASPYPCVFRKWFVGVRDHRLHHLGGEMVMTRNVKNGRHHTASDVAVLHLRYQQFFGYLDDLRIGYLHSSSPSPFCVKKTEEMMEYDGMQQKQQ